MKKRTINKIFSALIFLAILAVAWYFFYSKGAKQAQAPEDKASGASLIQEPVKPLATSTTAQPASLPPASSQPAKEVQGTFSSGENQPDGSSIQVLEMVFDGKTITPESVNIKVDDYVFLKNSSSSEFWPEILDPNSKLAANLKAAIQPGKQFKFQFKTAGQWKYIDIRSASSKILGTVNVAP